MAIPNQASDSSHFGFLQPSEPPFPDAQIIPGVSLENFLQQWVAGVSYMEETLVRPRWQLIPPNLPDVGTDWAAVGIIETRPEGIYPAMWPFIYPNYGLVQYQRHEWFQILVSFYGPQAEIYSSNLHDGSGVWQNYSVLRRVGVALVEVHESRRAPELVKAQWLNRIDMPISFRRIIRKNYPVLSILGLRGWLHSCAPDVPFQVPPPGGWPRPPMGEPPDDGNVYGRTGDDRWVRAVRLHGDTMEGPLRTAASPVSDDELANKRYVDDFGWPLDAGLY